MNPPKNHIIDYGRRDLNRRSRRAQRRYLFLRVLCVLLFKILLIVNPLHSLTRGGEKLRILEGKERSHPVSNLLRTERESTA